MTRAHTIAAAAAVVVLLAVGVLWATGTFSSPICGDTWNAQGAYAGRACGHELTVVRKAEALRDKLKAAVEHEEEAALNARGEASEESLRESEEAAPPSSP